MARCKIILFVVTILLLLPFCSKKREEEKDPINLEQVSWPIFRGDPNLSGLARDKPGEQPKLLWTFKTGSEIISSAVIGFGRVYIGSTDSKVYAIGLKDGDKIWEFDSGDDIEASPLLLNQTLYIGSLSGDFFALDAHTGKIRWKYEIKTAIYGSANWIKLAEKDEYLVLVGSHDNRMYCFTALTGELKWTFETDHYINGAPATDGKHIVFGGCDEKLHIVTALKGIGVGGVGVGSYIPGSAALVDNKAYLGHYDNRLVCIDLEKQKVVWEYEDRDHGDAFFSSPAVDSRHVVIGSRDGFLHCVNRETGEKIWTFRTGDEIDSSPVIAGNRVVVGSIDGRLYIVNLDTGKRIWYYEIGAPIIGSPAVAGGFIIIGAEDSRVYAFGEKQ